MPKYNINMGDVRNCAIGPNATVINHEAKIDKQTATNPLECGCSAVGLQQIDPTGHMIYYEGVHVKHCPLHNAASDLLESCLAEERLAQYVREHGYERTSTYLALRMDAYDKREAAIAKAKGE
ncbi:MAG: hypothetical protein ACW99U_21795 [Candidatus Thorarchaeota archaeon]|jgi:hypothetical protein